MTPVVKLVRTSAVTKNCVGPCRDENAASLHQQGDAQEQHRAPSDTKIQKAP
jgi:hypothetical protein